MPAAQLRRPLLAAAASGLSRPTATLPTANTLGRLHEALAQLRIGGGAESRRWASVKAQGAYKLRDSKTIPKKLGAKKTGDMYVIPGNIIFKQRGTKWFPGENVGMGRDHTIFALATGYVKYYKDPAKHPKRQYIGVVFNKDDKLPYHRHAMRKRKLNLTANVIVPPAPIPELSSSGIPNQVIRTGTGRKPNPRDTRIMKLGAGGDPYAYAEESWRLGTLVRTEKRKMGSRRVAMRHRRIKRKGILNEMRELREDKIKARKENAAGRYRNYMARRRLKYEKFVASRNAEVHAAASNPKGAEMPPPPPPGPTAGASASASAKAGGKTDGKTKKTDTKTKA